MYPSDEVRTGCAMPFCHPRTEFPSRIEASRGNRNWKFETGNSKFETRRSKTEIRKSIERPGWDAPISWQKISDACKSSI